MQTVDTILRFYAPFAALIAVVFWLGVLSNRVATLEREHKERKADEKGEVDKQVDLRISLKALETSYEAESKMVRLALAEIKTDSHAALEGIKREMAGVQRQIANFMKKPVREFGQERLDE